jgi:hypothetical protein
MGKPLYFVQRNWDARPIDGIFAAVLLNRDGTVKAYASRVAAQRATDLLNRRPSAGVWYTVGKVGPPMSKR